MSDNFGLYLVLTEPVAGYEACTEAAVAESVRFVQLRMKRADRKQRLDMARRLRTLTRHTDTLFIVNDDVTVAAEVDADGVHLGQQDMSLAEAQAFWNSPNKIFGWSTHNEDQVVEAQTMRPDYIGFGPIFPTPTKNPPDPVVGCQRLAEIVKFSTIPVVAIGGIDASNLKEVLQAGARNFAVVRAVCGQTQPRRALQELMDIWRTYVRI